MGDENELMKAATVETVCTVYTDTVRDVLEGFRLLRQAEDRLRAFLEYPHVLPAGWGGLYDDTGARAVEQIRRDCWRYVYGKTQIDTLCSVRQQHDFHEMLSRGELPELTLENVGRLLDNLRAKLPNMLEAAIKEVFEYLRPNDQLATFRTNARYQVGPKVILSYAMATLFGGRFYLHDHDRERLQALDNVFHLLDGQGTARYNGNLVSTIEYHGSEKRQSCETRYFECRWFKKGTLHITFKRQDLLDELNRRGGAAGDSIGDQETGRTVKTQS